MAENDDDQVEPLTVTIPVNADHEDLIDNILFHDLRKALGQSTGDAKADRRALAMVAANIADDRYHGGSMGARTAVFVLIEHGWDALKDFIADLEHHEH